MVYWQFTALIKSSLFILYIFINFLFDIICDSYVQKEKAHLTDKPTYMLFPEMNLKGQQETNNSDESFLVKPPNFVLAPLLQYDNFRLWSDFIKGVLTIAQKQHIWGHPSGLWGIVISLFSDIIYSQKNESTIENRLNEKKFFLFHIQT